MPDRSKRRRRASWQRVRLHRQFTIAEAASETGTCRATVRRWIKDGLVVLPGPGPKLILSDDLRDYLRAKLGKKKPCAVDQFYCFKCREPRKALGRMADYIPLTTATGNLQALCADCGTVMHKVVSLGSIASLTAILDVAIRERNGHIKQRGSASENVHFSKDHQPHG